MVQAQKSKGIHTVEITVFLEIRWRWSVRARSDDSFRFIDQRDADICFIHKKQCLPPALIRSRRGTKFKVDGRGRSKSPQSPD